MNPDKIHATTAPLSYRSVSIDDSFWTPKIRLVREQTIPYQYRQCEATGRIDAFRLTWKPGMDNQPHYFWDSDVAKWLEAASYSLGVAYDPETDRLLDEVINLIASAQQPDGYLNTYFTVVEPQKRWLDLRDGHELYCAGHLIEAAIAHYEATGKRTLLDVMCRYADYIDSVFGSEPGKRRGYCGHEEIELALVKLYRLTGNQRYLRLSAYFINERGQSPHYYDREKTERGTPGLFDEHNEKVGITDVKQHTQSHLPVREQTEAVGHAVRAMYLYSGMADVALETGDAGLLEACRRLWANVTAKRMYLTGGVGSAHHNEGFTSDYDLPNETAYCETCAAIGLMLWSHRMLTLDGNSRYADVLERALYNGIISGMSLDGKAFFYDNPLASRGNKHRQEWFGCSCCPPNIARMLTSLGGYIYAQSQTEAIVHLYIGSEGAFDIQGERVTIRQQTNYPWDGQVQLSIATDRTLTFPIRLRIPGWCDRARIFVNGVEFARKAENGYISLEQEWRNGDKITLEMDMPVKRVYAHPNVTDNAGHVALMRGPLVYCIEQADHAADIWGLRLQRDARLEAQFCPDWFGGAAVIHGEAEAAGAADWNDTLYRNEPPRIAAIPLTAIPYYAWDNRQPGAMKVWLPEA